MLRRNMLAAMAAAALAACGGGGSGSSDTPESDRQTRPTPTPPGKKKVTLAITSPTAGQTVSGTINVTGTDGGLTVSAADGSTNLGSATITPSSTFSISVNTTLLANGAQGIAVGMATSVPPHNVAELLDAALYLISHPEADTEALLQFAPGPDFPTGGIVVDDRASISETYRTGRGSFRLRSRWVKEDTGRGGWVAVVTEIPYGVQKGRLIEQLAELFNEKKAPLLGDVRDESTEDVRIVLEPRARNVEPAVMMEQLFKLSELETRISVNMNVLVDGVTPRVIGLGEALQQWLDHRRDVLQRRSRHRLAAIERRLELVAGMIIVFLNLDEVIRIIREQDEPKGALMARFALSDVQANYVLDTRLRALRRLEEMALRKEETDLREEKGQIEAMLASDKKQWQIIAHEIRDTKKKYGPESKIGKRRTTFEAPPNVVMELAESLIEREPVTVLLSKKGWIRALKGHVADLSTATFKGDDGLQASFFAETTSKVLVLASDGKVYTLEASKLPGGRSQGEPVRLMADIDETASIVAAWPYAAGEKMLIAASDGRGFVVGQDELISSTRKGRGVLNVDAPAIACLATSVAGDHVATIGENRKLLAFPLAQIPEMARGKGVRLQRYKDGGLSDARVFALDDGLTWRDSANRTFTVIKTDLKDWIGNRAEAGRLPPKGFPKNNKFEG